MKRVILFALIAVLFVALFTGCRAYRRTDVTAPGHAVTHTDGAARNRGFHYRSDGYVAGSRATHGTHHARDGMTRGHHYRHDGLVTDTDGLVGNGTHADRAYTARPNVDGVHGVTHGAHGTIARGASRDVVSGRAGTTVAGGLSGATA